MTKIEICELIWWIIKILCSKYPSPMKQVEKSKLRTNIFWWMLEFFLIYPVYIGNIIYLAKIVTALSSNKFIYFAFLQKVNNYIATKLCVRLINNCTIFLRKIAHDTIQWLNCVMQFSNYENELKTDLRNVTHSFEVHWNESACRKKVSLGLEQVIYIFC